MDAPQAPDPAITAQKQGEMNTNTATTQQLLNMTDQVTPDGTLTYNQTGNNTFTGADGKTYTVPKFTATQTLSPTQQLLKTLSDKTKTNIGQIGVDQSARIGDLLGTNLKLGNEATEARLMELGSKRLDPMFARSEEALRTRLTNSGVQPGSEAWNAEMTQFQQGRNDAYDQLLLTGRGQANQELLTERNQPINEISALMSGSQVALPSFTNTPQTDVAGVDYSGLVNSNYQAQAAQHGAMMGGLFGLGGQLGGAGIKAAAPFIMKSDRRLKTEIRRIGTSEFGIPLYEYTIFGKRTKGVMADDVAQMFPDYVIDEPDGFKAVNYTMLGLS